MSLMLRKYCQPTLDRAGLGAYHVSMTDKSRNLVIAGECGKPLLTVAGITFPKISPTKGEIEYAQELLVDFLRVHKTKIDKYIKLHNRFVALPTPSEKDVNFKIITTSSHYPDFQEIFTTYYFDGCLEYKISQDQPIARPHAVRPQLTVSDIVNNTVTTKTHTHAAKLFKTFLSWKNIEKELEDMRALLSSCDI